MFVVLSKLVPQRRDIGKKAYSCLSLSLSLSLSPVSFSSIFC
jgi:hypothetical protein